MIQQIKRILDQINAYCLICDENKRVIFSNKPLMRKRSGKDVQLPCHELLFYMTEQCPWCVQSDVKDGKPLSKEVYNPVDNRHYFLLISPIELEDGTIGYLHLAIPKERDELEGDRVRRYANFLEKIIENAPIMIFGNKGGKICLFNEECQRVTGYSRQEVLGKDLFELFVTDEDRPRVLAHCKLVNEGGFEPGFEFAWKTKDGRLRHIMWNCMLLEDPEGEPIVFGMGVDITDKKRLEEQFLQAQKMETVGRMAGGLAHDINNFLTAVRSSAELALLNLNNTSKIQQNLERILNAVERTSTLTRQLLTFSRKEIIRPEYLNVNEIIHDIAEMLKKLLGEDIKLETILNQDVGTIYADRSQLEQVLVNLAVNARDAMPNGGTLQIETGRTYVDYDHFPQKIGLVPGDYAIVSVSDTGEGMDPRIIPYVFDPFFTTKPKGKGTGLGLSTVYSIIKQNGGHISLYSEPGRGTTFKIYWPVALSKGDTQNFLTLNTQRAVTVRSKGETILVVEDDLMVLETVCSLLESLGYNVLSAQDAQKAVEISKLHTGAIDLLFTDVILPESNGKELYERLKKAHPDLKVLFTSGYTENIIAKHGILEDGVHFLQKPYELSHLAKMMRQILDGVE